VGKVLASGIPRQGQQFSSSVQKMEVPIAAVIREVDFKGVVAQQRSTFGFLHLRGKEEQSIQGIRSGKSFSRPIGFQDVLGSRTVRYALGTQTLQ
jgi:hypothetical protein